MKTVGVLLRKYDFENSFGYYAVNVHVLRFLKQYPVKLIGIFSFEEEDDLNRVKELIDECDGIILTGGMNGYEIDYKITEYLHTIDKPTFGICLGMQYMGKIFNGHITIKCEGHNGQDYYAHKVKIDENSLLFKILGEKDIMVNTLHNFHLPDNLDYKTLDIVGRSEDGIIEAVEDKSKKFFLGVQWHPEILLDLDDVNSKKLFDYFISKL